MITVPAKRVHQFGVYFPQAILGVRDVQNLVNVLEVNLTLRRAGGVSQPCCSSPLRQKGAGIDREILAPTAFSHAPPPHDPELRRTRGAPCAQSAVRNGRMRPWHGE